MLSKLLLLIALTPAALGAPTAAQKAQARKDWADIVSVDGAVDRGTSKVRRLTISTNAVEPLGRASQVLVQALLAARHCHERRSRH